MTERRSSGDAGGTSGSGGAGKPAGPPAVKPGQTEKGGMNATRPQTPRPTSTPAGQGPKGSGSGDS